MEDWVNCEKMSVARPDAPVVIINGALDKVRGGFYPAVFFPQLAKTVDCFYNKFESVFYVKPVSDKGMYGLLYRVYPMRVTMGKLMVWALKLDPSLDQDTK